MAVRKAACARQLCNVLYCHAIGVRGSSIFRHPFTSMNIHSISQSRFCTAPIIIENGDTTKDIETKKEKEKNPIWYYNNKGIRKRKINQLVRKASELQCEKNLKGEKDVVHMARMLQTFGKCDITAKDVQELLLHKPLIFKQAHKQVYKVLMELQDKGYSNHIVRKMLLSSPGLLLKKEEDHTVEKRFNKLKALDIEPRLSPEKCIYLGQKCPELLTVSDTDKLNAKIKNLKKLNFTPTLLHELIMKFPKVLLMSETAVKDKVTYVCNEMKGRPAIFTNFPRVLTTSLRRLKDRWSYLLSEGFVDDEYSRISERKMRAIVLTTDEDFAQRVCGTRLKDYRKFQKKLLKQEALNAEALTATAAPDVVVSKDTDDVTEIKDGVTGIKDEVTEIKDGVLDVNDNDDDDEVYDDNEADEDDEDDDDDDDDDDDEKDEFYNEADAEAAYHNKYKLDSFHNDELYLDSYRSAYHITKHTVDENNEWYNRPFEEDGEEDYGVQHSSSQRRAAKGYRPKGFKNYKEMESIQDDLDDDISWDLMGFGDSSDSPPSVVPRKGRRGRRR